MEKTSGLTLGKGMPFSSAVSALFVIFIMITSQSASAQVKQEWVARYNFGQNENFASALAVDAVGNVHVTGRSRGIGVVSEYATIKYDASGNELWVARYKGPSSSTNIASAIAVDKSGNVYVTGSAGLDGYATIKYDANGIELWVARYDNGVYSDTPVVALAVDAAGNVYVTGPTWDRDYATIKYDASGNELWVARYNGPDNVNDWPVALVVDASGNVYVTGSSETSVLTWFNNYATIKYDANGNELWVARYNGPGNQFNEPMALAVDAIGNVYVTGRSDGLDTVDSATIKYDASGNELWVARYKEAWAAALALDASGNVYVTGNTGSDYATIKYDASGNELWVARYNGPDNANDGANAIAVDAAGNVYVTGVINFQPSYYPNPRNTYDDIATIKYDANGNELWVARYNGPANNVDSAAALVVDAAGNVYVTGCSRGTSSYDYVTIKLMQNGSDSGDGGGCFISTIAP